VGGGSGVLTLWEKGAWDDQDERIVVNRSAGGGESLDVLAVVPDELGKGKVVAVGQSDGLVRFIQIGPNRSISEASHDEVEGVVGLGFDVDGRMISAGGSIVKVWHEAVGNEDEDDEEEEEEPESDEEEGKEAKTKPQRKHKGSDDDSDDDDDDDDSDAAEGKDRRKRKKRKRGKGKDRSGGQHVMAFKGLD
jgi:hypothetical protein